MTTSWFFLSTLNYDARSTTHQFYSVSVIQTSQLMLYREIIAVYSEIHTKHINAVCGQNVEVFNDPGGTVHTVTIEP